MAAAVLSGQHVRADATRRGTGNSPIDRWRSMWAMMLSASAVSIMRFSIERGEVFSAILSAPAFVPGAVASFANAGAFSFGDRLFSFPIIL
jgi:hypothetical protein